MLQSLPSFPFPVPVFLVFPGRCSQLTLAHKAFEILSQHESSKFLVLPLEYSRSPAASWCRAELCHFGEQ